MPVTKVLRTIGRIAALAVFGAIGGAVVYGIAVRFSYSVGLFQIAEGSVDTELANESARFFGTMIGAPFGALLFPFGFLRMRKWWPLPRVFLVAFGAPLAGGLLGALLSPVAAGLTGAMAFLVAATSARGPKRS